jgi:bifunctional non-homologous end joining protein LigD
MPVSWDQLPDLKSGAHWTVQTARDQLSFQRQDPWETYWSSPQHIDEAMATLGVSTRGMIRR